MVWEKIHTILPVARASIQNILRTPTNSNKKKQLLNRKLAEGMDQSKSNGD